MDINNNLEYVNISCNLVDTGKNFVNGKRSDIFIQIPIPSDRLIKGTNNIYFFSSEKSEGINLNNGVYNELRFTVWGNNNSDVGNVLLEFNIK